MGDRMDHTAFLASIPAEDRVALTSRDDASGLKHLARHAGLIVILQVYVTLGLPLWWAMLLPLGIALAFLFTLQHECTHKTPFKTGWMNEVAGHITGLILVQPFEWFRAFHMAHHRFTNDPDRDPELSESPPETVADLLWHLSTLGYWSAKFQVLVSNAGGGEDVDYISARTRPRIVWEARAMLVLYALSLASLLWTPVLFWIWLLPLAIGFPFLRFYLLAEHGRCPSSADMFNNTRTTLTNKALRFLAWNMPYHTEHHVWPSVPFHRLPEVHLRMRSHLKHLEHGYHQFARAHIAAIRKTEV